MLHGNPKRQAGPANSFFSKGGLFKVSSYIRFWGRLQDGTTLLAALKEMIRGNFEKKENNRLPYTPIPPSVGTFFIFTKL